MEITSRMILIAVGLLGFTLIVASTSPVMYSAQRFFFDTILGLPQRFIQMNICKNAGTDFLSSMLCSGG